MHTELHDHDRRLGFDLATLSRRHALGLLAGAGLVTVSACTSDSGPGDAAGDSVDVDSGECGEEMQEETAGPFPADGSNGPDVLSESGIVRADITTSFGADSGRAEGVPTTIELVVQDASDDCSPFVGAAVYLWHCTREGEYSLYSNGLENENFLRGVQVADDSGRVSFTSVFPGCYSGRWPHIHFEVYASQQDATGGGQPIRTSQLALPEGTCDEVYDNADGYVDSARNFAGMSLPSDMVFSDGSDTQMATASGDAAAGYTVSLTVPVVP